MEPFYTLGKVNNPITRSCDFNLVVIVQDFIQNSLGDLVSLWVLNEPLDKRSSVGVALVELGRLETWLLRHARGELDFQSAFGKKIFMPSFVFNSNI